ncbi:MAG: hypothetical protein ACFCU9_09820 [Cyanophyceae cyanobacterium]
MLEREHRVQQLFVDTIAALPLEGPYFVEQRLARRRGPFLRAVKDVAPGEAWWEILYFFKTEELCWAFLPTQRSSPYFAWGYTAEQAYLNGILTHGGKAD